MKNNEKTDAMKPFDERFADKVREVFDQHQEAYDPGAWEMMQRRLSAKKKPVFIALWPYLSRAAVVLLLVGGMAWLAVTYIPGNDNMLATSLDETLTSRTEIRQSQAAAQRQVDEPKVPTTPQPADPKDVIKQVLPSAQSNSKESDDRPKTTISVNGLTSLPIGVDMGKPASVQATDPSHETDKEKGQRQGQGIEKDQGQGQGVEKDQGHDVEKDLGQGTEKGQVAEITYPDYVPEPPGSAIAKSENKAFNWSVMAGSMMTYAEQQLADGLGFSGGFLTEWKVSPLVRISSGLVLAYQQFDVDGMPLYQKMSTSDMYYAPENFSVQTLANHEYEMLAFDIPMNIQFQLAESHKSKWYVTAGFSSLLYLQQHVTGQETAYVEAQVNDQLASSRTLSYASKVSINASYDAFQRFDFARLLNLSFGYEIRGEKRATIIEPFIKYPLGTVSSREIKMGMGGVSLRYRFGN